MVAGPSSDRQALPPWAMMGSRVGAEAPVAVFVVNEKGIVVWANTDAERVIGPDVEHLVGCRVMDVVHEDDWLTVVSSLAYAGETPGVSVGPIRVRHCGRSPVPHRANLWAKSMVHDPTIRGTVVSWIPEVTHQLLADAVTSATAGRPLSETLAVLVRSTLAIPFDSPCSVIEVNPSSGAVLRHISSAGAPYFLHLTEPKLPWIRSAQLEMAVNDADLGAYGPRYQPSRTGFSAVWCRPIPSNIATTYVLAVWRPTTQGIDPSQHQELDRLVEVAQLCIEAAASDDLLRYAASHDRLTGIANREWLGNFDGPLFATDVLFVDLDNFKEVNDRFGHAVGDEVLQVVARRLVAAVRSEDLVTRYGGDEFVILCRNPTTLAETEEVAKRVVATLSAQISVSKHIISLSASVGIATGGPHNSMADLIARADQAMLRGKVSAKGTYTFA